MCSIPFVQLQIGRANYSAHERFRYNLHNQLAENPPRAVLRRSRAVVEIASPGWAHAGTIAELPAAWSFEVVIREIFNKRYRRRALRFLLLATSASRLSKVPTTGLCPITDVTTTSDIGIHMSPMPRCNYQCLGFYLSSEYIQALHICVVSLFKM